MPTFEFDVYDLSSCALGVVRAAVKYAKLHSSEELHVVPFEHFCGLAGLAPNIPLSKLRQLLNEVKHTGVFSTDFEPEVLRGWSVFDHLVIRGTNLEFSICSYAFAASDPAEPLPIRANAALLSSKARRR